MTRERELVREELRALLVLGIIGTLLGVRDLLGMPLGFGFHVIDLTNDLMLFWGAYVFLMAIGISDDWMNERAVWVCGALAEIWFVIGIAVTGAIALSVGLILIVGLNYPSFVNSWAGAITLTIPSIISVPVIYHAIAKTKLPSGRKKTNSNQNQE